MREIQTTKCFLSLLRYDIWRDRFIKILGYYNETVPFDAFAPGGRFTEGQPDLIIQTENIYHIIEIKVAHTAPFQPYQPQRYLDIAKYQHRPKVGITLLAPRYHKHEHVFIEATKHPTIVSRVIYWQDLLTVMQDVASASPSDERADLQSFVKSERQRYRPPPQLEREKHIIHSTKEGKHVEEGSDAHSFYLKALAVIDHSKYEIDMRDNGRNGVAFAVQPRDHPKKVEKFFFGTQGQYKRHIGLPNYKVDKIATVIAHIHPNAKERLRGLPQHRGKYWWSDATNIILDYLRIRFGTTCLT